MVNRRCSLFSVAVLALSPLFAAADRFDQFTDTLADDWMRADPNAATRQQYFTGSEQDALDRQLTPITKDARVARGALARRGLAELPTFDRKQLSNAQRISAAMLEWQLDEIVKSEPFEEHDFVFNQFRGLQVQLVNFLSQIHPVRNRRDIENYLARLDLVAGQIDEGIAQAGERAARGMLPPKFILTATIAQIGRFLASEPAQNVLVVSLDERATKVRGLSAGDRSKFVAAAKKTVAAQIIPAFRRAQSLLEKQLPRSSDDAGLWRLPDGEKAYAAMLRRNTTSALTSEQIHALGLKEVARIEAQMDILLRALGYIDGSVNDRYEKLETDLQPKEAEPRPALLARYTDYVRDAEKRAALIFDLRPKARCEVRREPPFTEENAAAHYTGPARDGTRPGIFWVPLPGPSYRVVSMRSLAYHEAVPGHHFQIALQSEMPNLAKFRRERVFGGLSAHTEGWALYAERLAAESNWYEGDKIGALGQLDSELFRARRLVVDTGLHAKKWTRQQAIDYGIKAAEVERYVVMPGQACSYKIGELRILECREKAKRALGAKFSLKQFHNVILRNGNVPLDVLEQIIDGFIETSKN